MAANTGRIGERPGEQAQLPQVGRQVGVREDGHVAAAAVMLHRIPEAVADRASLSALIRRFQVFDDGNASPDRFLEKQDLRLFVGSAVSVQDLPGQMTAPFRAAVVHDGQVPRVAGSGLEEPSQLPQLLS